MSKEKDAILYNLENDRIKVLEDGTIIGVWGNPLKPIVRSDKYCSVGLTLNGKTTSVLIHRLVCWNFTKDIRMWDYDFHVHHINENRQDNRIGNLMIVSASEHVSKHNSVSQLGSKNSNAKLNEQKVFEIRKLYATGDYSQKQLGDLFGVSRSNIGFIVNRNWWKK